MDVGVVVVRVWEALEGRIVPGLRVYLHLNTCVVPGGESVSLSFDGTRVERHRSTGVRPHNTQNPGYC